MQPSENLYDQKPEEPPIQASTSTNSIPAAGSSFTSRFEYVDNIQAVPTSSGGTHVINHVAPPKSSSFFAEFGMDGGFPKKTATNSSKIQVSYAIYDFVLHDCRTRLMGLYTYTEKQLRISIPIFYA